MTPPPPPCGCTVDMVDIIKWERTPPEIIYCPLHANAHHLREALMQCVTWMKPVMDGFAVPQDAESRINLEVAQSLLRSCEKGKGN